MRLLNAVPKSILWIREGSPAMNTRFLEVAAAKGIDRSRIVFAGRVESFEKHLGRMREADLFLDTFPYNAHVTASDALWAGLPVVTLQGNSFAARVAAGFLVNLGLDELVASTLDGYEALALSLATDVTRLAKIRERLWDALYHAVVQCAGVGPCLLRIFQPSSVESEQFGTHIAPCSQPNGLI